jgi:hypothetical protein
MLSMFPLDVLKPTQPQYLTNNPPPCPLPAHDSALKLNIIDRKGQVHNRLTMSNDGTHIKAMSEMLVNDPDTDASVFTTAFKLLNNVNRPVRNLIGSSMRTSEIASPVDQKLQIKAINLFIKGIEGTQIDGKGVLVTAEENISLKPVNNSIELADAEGIYINTERLPIATKSTDGSRLQNKVYACFDKSTKKYTLMQVKLRFDSDLKYIKC